MDGKRIAEARERKGWSQKDLAEALKTSQATIHRYESGSRDPKSNVVVALASALDVTVSYLLGLTDEPNPTDLYDSASDSIYKVGSLTNDEMQLVEMYRQCTPSRREMLLSMARDARDASIRKEEDSESFDKAVNE